MLETVEQIENAIADLIIKHQHELGAMHDRVDFVTQQAEKLLAEREKELDLKYQNYTDAEQAETEYLAEYRQAKKTILEAVENTLKKEAEDLLAKIS